MSRHADVERGFLARVLQHLALQSVCFVIPTVLASSLSSDAADAQRFLCLSILAVALWQALQLLRRGPVGSGYPIPGTHTVALIGAFALVGQTGGGFGTAGALLMLTGLVCVLLGALGGVPIAHALGHGVPHAGELLAAHPWLALPEPWVPRFDQIQSAPLLAFLVAIVALQADEMRERFGVWLATRRAQAFRQRSAGTRSEAWIAFEA